nr:MAG TPA: hypothetical protein [Herelleviridae sp.]
MSIICLIQSPYQCFLLLQHTAFLSDAVFPWVKS